jgi:hypothetical protein
MIFLQPNKAKLISGEKNFHANFSVQKTPGNMRRLFPKYGLQHHDKKK